MNVLCFVGNIGKDAEQRFTGSGDSIVSFSVALSHGYGERKGTAWMRCQMFGKRGESVLPYLVKGQQVAVTGEFAPREYEKDGQTRMSLDVRVNDLTLVGGKRTDSQAPAQQEPARHQEKPNAYQQASGGFGNFDDDLPF